MAKPVFVVSVLMAKHVFVVSVGLRVLQNSKVNQFFLNLKKENYIVKKQKKNSGCF